MENSYRENRVHGTQKFPCAYYQARSREIDRPFGVKYHWHEEVEFIFLQQGRFHLEINMEQYELEAPCICVINSGELHELYTLSENYEESAVVFHPRLLCFQENDQMQEEIIDSLMENQLQFPRFILPGDTIWEAILKEYLCMEQAFLSEGKAFRDQMQAKKAVSQLNIKATLLKILFFLCEREYLQVKKEKEDIKVSYIKSALTYVHKHYKEKIYIRDLANEAGLNEQYFCRLFRKLIRMSPVEYINSYRMKKAIALLEQTELSVTEVAYESGFHDMGGFIRGFKAITDTTPLQYRKKFRTANEIDQKEWSIETEKS